jgi:anti-sigma factor RsiW
LRECSQIESLLPLFVDGSADAHQIKVVETHLAHCPACRDGVPVERAARAILRAHRTALMAQEAGRGHAAGSEPGRPLGWMGRLTAAGLAAGLVLGAATIVELMPVKSNVVFAAQAAVDHVRCLLLAAPLTHADGAVEMEREIARQYGWSVRVPASEPGVTLLGVRRCPWGIGPHAHLMYGVGDRTVSLFITPGVERETAELSLFGHVERVWASGGQTYALVARGVPVAELDRLAAYFRRATDPVTASPSAP